ncbi:hypothetical protein BDV19DRAFT_43836 [Aspergillus venezuelensis]
MMKRKEEDPETQLLRQLQWCTRTLAQHPHLWSNTKVSTAIDSLRKGSRSRKRKRDPLYQPPNRSKRRQGWPQLSKVLRNTSGHASAGHASSGRASSGTDYLSFASHDPKKTTTQAHQSEMPCNTREDLHDPYEATNVSPSQVSQEASDLQTSDLQTITSQPHQSEDTSEDTPDIARSTQEVSHTSQAANVTSSQISQEASDLQTSTSQPHQSEDTSEDTLGMPCNTGGVSHTPREAENITSSQISQETSDPKTVTTQAHPLEDITEHSSEIPCNTREVSHTHVTLLQVHETQSAAQVIQEPSLGEAARSHVSCESDTSLICPEHPMTIELAVELVCYYSQQLYQPPQRLYIEVVHSIRDGTKIQDSMEDALKTIRWGELAETSSARQQKSVIYNLLEHIAVSTWLDQQISHAEQNFRTARNKPYTSRAATTKVLDSIFGKKDQTGQRDHLNTIRYRGNVLRDRLVSHIGLGILFSPVAIGEKHL